MANEQGFSHIKVTSSDQADEVIYAGVSAQPKPDSPEQPEQSNEQAQSQQPAQGEEQAQGGKAAQPQQQAQAAQPKQPKRQKPADDGYRETTLEDLKGTKAPLAQKLVIIAAIVLIIVAIAYYFAVLR